MLKQENIAIVSNEESKLAALFFDKICPTTFVGVPDEVCVEASLVSEVHNRSLGELFLNINHYKSDSREDHVALLRNRIIYEYLQELAKYNYDAVPVFVDSSNLSIFLNSGTTHAIEIDVMNTGVIDGTKLKWEQVLDIRSDKEASAGLRRFRLFLADNYAKKDSAYVADSILTKLDDYERTCAKHGVELVTSSVKSVLHSKSLIGSLSVGAASLLAGEPFLANLSILTGGIIEIGKLSISIAETKIEHRYSNSMSEIAYLSDLKKKVDS